MQSGYATATAVSLKGHRYTSRLLAGAGSTELGHVLEVEMDNKDKNARTIQEENTQDHDLQGVTEEELANLDIEVREIQRSVRPRGVLAE